MSDNKQAWFGRKRIGWGWGPRSWQGWMAVFIYAVLMIVLPASLGPQLGDRGVQIVWLGLTILFFIVFFWKLDRARRL